MTSNTAAYLRNVGQPLEIGPAPYTAPGVNEIIVKNAAIALNPADCAIQALGKSLFPYLEFPIIMGFDCAGEVVEVGPGVTRLRPGDRVLAAGLGSVEGHSSSENTFQQYTVVKAQAAALIPHSMSFESAAVLPIGLCTAATALFCSGFLGLQRPTVPAQPPTGQSIVIWGGASSVGCNAIQLATLAGYGVLTTCSPKNFELVKSLGATHAFDYNSSTVVNDIIAVLKDKTIVGAIPITLGSAIPCFEIVSKSRGRKFVASGMPLPEANEIPEGVEVKFIYCVDLFDDEIGPMIFDKFLPHALKTGVYKALPEPKIVGKGLEYVQKGLEVLSKGVSATKIVVSL